MPHRTPRRDRAFPAAGFILLIFLWSVSAGEAQELPLKRGLPGADVFSCPEVVPGVQPGAAEQAEARVLGSTADQALVLGDQTRARDHLARAIELDPLSAELAYRYARILEDLGEISQAIDQFCRALGLGSEELGIEDVSQRLETLIRSVEPQVPAEAVAAFSNGLTQADLGNLTEAIQAFDAVSRIAPEWADAVYNRGVLRDRQGDIEGAVADLQEFLVLQPEGADAIAVSQRIGQLQSFAPLPSAGTTLTLGVLIPGMGQFYSGRALGGFTVLALAGGAAAAGFLIEEVQTRCVGSISQGAECPPDRVISTNTTNPYLTPSLIAAGVVTVFGAVEAFLKVRKGGSEGDEELVTMNVGGAHFAGPSVSAEGPRLNLSLFRVNF